MMLTPDTIQKKEFEQSVLGGYRRDEVDAFLDEVEADYRRLYDENKDLIEKLKACLSKIEDYKKDEDFLKSAIINAQRLNETTLREIELREKEVEVACKEKAAAIIAEAEAQAAAIIEKAERESADAVQAARAQCQAEIEDEQAKCDAEVRRIRSAVEAEEKRLEYLRKQVAEFKSTILDIYRAHVTSISKLPDFTQSEEVKASPKAEEKAPVVAEPAPVKAEPVKEEPVEEAVVEEVPDAPVDEAAEVADDSTVEFKLEGKPEKKEPEEPKPSKFGNLKFGVGYDINDDE